MGGAIFRFSLKIGLKSTKKHAILHTSQANGATLLRVTTTQAEILFDNTQLSRTVLT